MNILTIDTSGPVCAVALMRDEVIVYEARANTGLTHSEALMPMVDLAMRAAGLAVKQLDLICCVAGPGSFTGVRIGVCAARALAHAWGIRVARLDALAVLAMGAWGFDGTVCPILDARRGQVYGAAFRMGGDVPARLMDDVAVSFENYIEKLPGGRLLFVGDGVTVNEAKIRALGGRALIAPPHIRMLSAAAGCALAARDEGTHMEHRQLTPIYLRAPQAERERAERQAQNG